MSYESRKPSLPQEHPFENVFLGWYWSSTTAAINPSYAWYVHMEGARMFYGRKDQYYLFLPVRGAGYGILLQTGQSRCYDSEGEIISCTGSGQDGEYQYGIQWPRPRFEEKAEVVIDRLTGLCWTKKADMAGLVTWQGALDEVGKLNRKGFGGRADWRLPNINELESLVDCSCHSPALADEHPFQDLREAYWSSTTSFFETNWGWVLYMIKGACGVGHKPGSSFYVWPVCSMGGKE
jgi:hypothetical protein